MHLNDDLTLRTIVHGGDLAWVPSPAAGVERRMLFRLGEEKARATSIVRFAPGSHFAAHEHPGGEEFLVLEGVFQDETGDFPAGSYVRNPPRSAHSPSSTLGCTIFVRLWQFAATDRNDVACRPGEGARVAPRPGASEARILFSALDEEVSLECWEANAECHLANPHGLELLVVEGSFSDGGETLSRWSWLRLPAGHDLHAQTGSAGAQVWIRKGPLLLPDVVAFDRPGGAV